VQSGRLVVTRARYYYGVNCQSCRSHVEIDARYCHQCGQPISGGTPESLGPVTERRIVSVLFADLEGFTPFSAERDLEDVRELLTTYFDVSRRIVSRYGGAVEKFIGDAVMAVWGAPLAREDDSERAVKAALELVATVGAIEISPGEFLHLRAGVVTGEAAVTLGSEKEGMVAGDLVNTASRLQTKAPAGSVFVDDATRAATEVTIVYTDAGELRASFRLLPSPVESVFIQPPRFSGGTLGDIGWLEALRPVSVGSIMSGSSHARVKYEPKSHNS
jgi:class 3 adenylate cyclase